MQLKDALSLNRCFELDSLVCFSLSVNILQWIFWFQIWSLLIWNAASMSTRCWHWNTLLWVITYNFYAIPRSFYIRINILTFVASTHHDILFEEIKTSLSLRWSHDEAVQLFLENTALSETFIKNEVRRYITLPGQVGILNIM